MAAWDHVVVDPGILAVGKPGIRHVEMGSDLTPQITAPQPPDGSTYAPPPPPTIRVRITG
jgi:hypothetical protein